ncbi:MAG: DUF2971 domain-containing protein [Actinomycetota bacterium]|nr:DUF2971 domain-containing protein [Ferrimicrobium sp.]MDA8270508.1 DUF2971 domain-containing protein [Actinomycetota bacterium]
MGDGPELLYHYTDAAGLVGIITTAELWATDALYLNDASEFTYVFELIREELQRLIKSDHPYPPGRAEVVGMIEFARELALDSLRDDMSFFIACFCEEKDLLSQWRGYARGTGGFAIGFKRIEKERLAPDYPPTSWKFERVGYDPTMQRAEIQKQLKKALRHNKPTGESCEALFDAWNSFKDGYFGDIGSKALLYKHPGFAEEKEWRIIVRLNRAKLINAGLPRFRTGSLGPVPYVLVDGYGATSPSRLPIGEIVIGPTQNPGLAERSIRLLLGSSGYDDVAITHSAIPLRA